MTSPASYSVEVSFEACETSTDDTEDDADVLRSFAVDGRTEPDDTAVRLPPRNAKLGARTKLVSELVKENRAAKKIRPIMALIAVQAVPEVLSLLQGSGVFVAEVGRSDNLPVCVSQHARLWSRKG
jgi:hypothetical protein